MPKSKLRCPTFSEVYGEDVVQSMAELGVNPKSITPKNSDKVYNSMVALAKKNGKLATIQQIQDDTGFSSAEVRSAVNNLRDRGRIQSVERGIYIPLVKKAEKK